MSEFESQVFGPEDGRDTAHGLSQRIGSQMAEYTLWKRMRRDGPSTEKPAESQTEDKVGDFYNHCAGQFFRDSYPPDVMLEEYEFEVERLLCQFTVFREEFAVQLAELGVVVEGSWGSELVKQMELDRLASYTVRMWNYYLDQARWTRPGSVERKVLEDEADFWKKLEAIVTMAIKQR